MLLVAPALVVALMLPPTPGHIGLQPYAGAPAHFEEAAAGAGEHKPSSHGQSEAPESQESSHVECDACLLPLAQLPAPGVRLARLEGSPERLPLRSNALAGWQPRHTSGRARAPPNRL